MTGGPNDYEYIDTENSIIVINFMSVGQISQSNTYTGNIPDNYRQTVWVSIHADGQIHRRYLLF